MSFSAHAPISTLEKKLETDSIQIGARQSTGTGAALGSRDDLLHDLAASTNALRTLAILSFAGYYIAHGQFEGDALTRKVTVALVEGLRGVRLYRPRPTEVAVLIPGSPEGAERVLAQAAAALTKQFPHARTVIGFGTAQLPAEANDPAQALRIADSRLPLRTPRERRLLPR
jgi:hypothetical protein